MWRAIGKTDSRKAQGTGGRRLWAGLAVLCGFAVCLAGLWYLWIYDGIHYGYEVSRPGTETFAYLELQEGWGVCQEIRSERQYLEGVELILINLEEDGKGVLDLRLRTEDGREIAAVQRPLGELRAGEWERFSLGVRLEKTRVYELELTSSGGTSSPYVLMAAGDNPAENLRAFYRGEPLGDGEGLLAGYGFAVTASTWEKTVISVLLFLFADTLWCWQRGAGKERSRDVSRTGSVLTAGMFGVQFLFMLPNIVYRLESVSLDPSWRYVLNIALPEGIRFGRDVFFTYGPLGYLCYLMKLPENGIYYWLGVGIWIAVIGIQAYLYLALYRRYRKGALAFEAVVFSFFCYIAAYTAAERDNYLLYTLVLSVTAYACGAPYVRAIPNLLLLLMFFGKFSTFTSGLAFLILYVAFDLVFQKRKGSLWLCLPGILAMPVCYLAYCPSLQSLRDYVAGIFLLLDGWMMSQQWDQVLSRGEVRVLACIMILYVLLVLLSLWLDYKSAAVLLACSASMFFVYKYASTRHGLVPGLWLFAMLFSAAVLSLDWKKMKLRCRGSGAACLAGFLWLFAICGTGILQAGSLHGSLGYVKEQFADKWNAWTHLGESGVPEEVAADNRLPDEILETVGASTVTVYPWRNGYGAVCDGLHMVYYPSIQNVNVLIPWLDQKVADWFRSDQAAEYIILSDETIDDHLKYVDNPLTWEAIRGRYRVNRVCGDLCLLERRNETRSPAPVLLSTGEYDTAQPIVCPEGADYVKIRFTLSAAGRLKKFFWHVGVTDMQLCYEDGSSASGRAIVPNLGSGFALTRIPQNLAELEAVLNGGDRTAVTSFSFSGLGLKDWKDRILVEWYEFPEE